MQEEVQKKLNSFFEKYTQVNGKKGDIFIHAEEAPVGIFYLQKGLVRQYVITPKGEELTVNIFKPPSFFPMMWAINDTANDFYFEAMEDVSLWRAPKNQTLDFLKSDPMVAFDLLSRLYRGIDGLLARLTYLMSASSRAKIIFTLLNMHYRFGKNDKHITHKELAAISGTTRETFSRELKKLEHEGIVETHNGVISITSVEKMEDVLARINRNELQLPE